MPLGMLGKYEKLDVLGSGATGIVYLAKDTLLNKQVALKEVNVQGGEMEYCLQEAQVLDRLRHPNIVQVNGVDHVEGRLLIDMEYVQGGNLQQLLGKQGRLPVLQAMDIAAQVLDALDYAHSRHVIHRDVKPGNILISQSGTAKLADFGQADILATNAYAQGAGTFAYMAPEDFDPSGRSDALSDLWAMGVTLYEMLAGQRPYQAASPRNPFAWQQLIRETTPVPLTQYAPEVPPELQEIVNHALLVDRKLRCQSAAEFRDDLLLLMSNMRAGKTDQQLQMAALQPAAPPPVLSVHAAKAESPAAALQTRLASTMQTAVSALQMPPALTQSSKARIRLIADPGSLDFGEARPGRPVVKRLLLRQTGPDSPAQVSVECSAEWLHVTPSLFDSTRQALTLTADVSTLPVSGERHSVITLRTEGCVLDVPLHVFALPPRPTFWQIAWWYLPMFALSLLPALVLILTTPWLKLHIAALDIPSGMSVSAILSLMLAQICWGAECGPAEKTACTAASAFLCGSLAITGSTAFLHASQHLSLQKGMHSAEQFLAMGGFVLLLQFFSRKWWRFWLAAALFSGMLSTGVILAAIAGGR